ncbi:hypothetical protein A3768_0603 [Ralstonia solanacearum]|nr:hypothetical protein A3768_0603 [Ralstonia solanacearum]
MVGVQHARKLRSVLEKFSARFREKTMPRTQKFARFFPRLSCDFFLQILAPEFRTT